MNRTKIPSIYIKQSVGASVTALFRGVSQINSGNKGPIRHPLGVFLISTARIRGPSGPEILVRYKVVCGWGGWSVTIPFKGMPQINS